MVHSISIIIVPDEERCPGAVLPLNTTTSPGFEKSPPSSLTFKNPDIVSPVIFVSSQVPGQKRPYTHVPSDGLQPH